MRCGKCKRRLVDASPTSEPRTFFICPQQKSRGHLCTEKTSVMKSSIPRHPSVKSVIKKMQDERTI